MAKRPNNNRQAARAKQSRQRKSKPYNKEKAVTTEEQEVTRKGHDNDGHWYAPNDQLLRDVGNIPYATRAGQALAFTDPTHPAEYLINSGTAETSFTPIGVVGIPCSTMPGLDTDGTGPINVAARNIQGFVVHANSRNLSYGAPNLMMLILALDNFYGFYQHAARMYGLIRTYSVRNANVPRAFFEAVGWDYDDFANNMPQFRYWLNTLAQQIGSLCIPAEMPFIERHFWMYSKVFADAPSTKASLYFYYPWDLYEYCPTGCPNDNLQDEFVDSQDTPGLRSHCISRTSEKFRPTGLTLADLQEIVRRCISSLLKAEDFAVMSGDILKAFGPDKVVRLSTVDENYYVTPEYLDHALWQIHNSYAVGFPADTAGAGQTSSIWANGLLISSIKEKVVPSARMSFLVTPEVAHAGTATCILSNVNLAHLLNMHHDDVDAEANMVATRLMAITDTRKRTVKVPGTGTEPTSVSVLGSGVVSCGSEVARAYVIVRKLEANLALQAYVIGNEVITSGNMTLPEAASALRAATRWSSLFWHPQQITAHAQFDEASGALRALRVNSFQYELENWTTVSSDVLRRMHECALLGEFEVPLMGVWNDKTAGFLKR